MFGVKLPVVAVVAVAVGVVVAWAVVPGIARNAEDGCWTVAAVDNSLLRVAGESVVACTTSSGGGLS